MTLTVILSIIFIHWVADFIFQAEEWATNKSKSFKALVRHTAMYSFIWHLVIFGFSVYGNRFNGPSFEDLGWTPWMITFPVITFVFHTLTDYFTSKIVSRKFANQEYGSPIPNFGAFTVIGFDQVLHYVQLFLTYHFLTI